MIKAILISAIMNMPIPEPIIPQFDPLYAERAKEIIISRWGPLFV